MVEAIKWDKGVLLLLDQRLLPNEVKYVACTDFRQTADAIANMVVRGAPAIGISGGYGVTQAAIEAKRKYGDAQIGQTDLAKVEEFLKCASMHLEAARPTAVNLSWAVRRVLLKTISQLKKEGLASAVKTAQLVARNIEIEDVEINRKIGLNGSVLIERNSNIMTHCNAGALATGGWGTALGVIRQAWLDGKVSMVYANETRPFLQGARLTAWELLQDDINVTLLVDSAAGYLMSLGKIDVVVVGADRIAANGDVANKIGTYAIACLCKHHRIPFYVAAPISTFDLTLSDGNKIHVEERSEMEVLEFSGRTVAPDGVRAFNPSFDITPKDLITGIITEKGTIFSPSEENVSKVLTFKTNSK